jgi:hypothetical protein
MHPLLAQPTTDQAKLLETVCRGFSVSTKDSWPTFQYVEAVLYRDHGLDATTLILECPRQGYQGALGHYGWIRHSGMSLSNPQPADTVALTVAGMSKVSTQENRVQLFLDVLAILVNAERPLHPSPDEVELVTVDAETVGNTLKSTQPSPQIHFSATRSGDVASLLSSEPSTSRCGVQPSQEDWVATLGSFLRRYEGVTSANDYVERVGEQLAPRLTETSVFYPSGLALPEAIDYLNAVWRLHANVPIFRIRRAESAAKLALECANPDEFESRISALCTILDDVGLPDKSGSKLIDLRAYMEKQLSDEAVGRAVDAVDDLRAVFDLRAWRQHAFGTEERLRRGTRRLGVELPAYDWGLAWATVQARCVAALNALREEVERLER